MAIKHKSLYKLPTLQTEACIVTQTGTICSHFHISHKLNQKKARKTTKKECVKGAVYLDNVTVLNS